MPPEVIISALAGVIVTLATVYHKSLTDRIKRGEDREDARDRLFERLADAIEASLGVKVPK